MKYNEDRQDKDILDLIVDLFANIILFFQNKKYKERKTQVILLFFVLIGLGFYFYWENIANSLKFFVLGVACIIGVIKNPIGAVVYGALALVFINVPAFFILLVLGMVLA